MEYIIDSGFRLRDTAVSLGKFDGLHVGHQSLIRRVLDFQKEGLLGVAFTFLTHPKALLTDAAVPLLTTEEEKRDRLSRMGVDALVSYPFSKEMLSMEPERFIEEILVGRLGARAIVVGENFRFGHGRRGDVALLRKAEGEYGFRVEVRPPVRMDGERVSSSRIRAAVGRGDMEMASRLLGSPYGVSGTVIHGKELGRKLGMPTANVRPPKEKLLPPFGVYASRTFADGVWWDGITNIGIKPTVTEERVRLSETFLFGYEGDLYEKRIDTRLHAFLRPERKFPSVELLKEQMGRDLAAAREILGASPSSWEQEASPSRGLGS